MSEFPSKLDVVSKLSVVDAILSNMVVACDVVRELSSSNCRSSESDRMPWIKQRIFTSKTCNTVIGL
jgi:hypothetical protein